MAKHTSALPDVPQRSTFVTVVSWILIVMLGWCAGIGVLQNTLLFSMRQSLISLMLFLAFFAVDVLGLLAAIAMLKRRNWGRLVIATGLLTSVGWFVVTVPFVVSLQ